MFQLVIFDMDGLMFDTEEVMCRAFIEVTGELGFYGTRDQFISLLGLSSADIQQKYREFYGDGIDAKELYRLGGERKLSIVKREGLPVKKGLFALLDAIDRLGIRKAVASSSDEQMILDNLDRAGLGGRFDLVVSAMGVKRGKPYPDLFLEVCSRLAVPPEKTLVLEDSQNGVEAALAGGIPVIHIPDFLRLPEETAGRCLAVCDSLDQVIPYLQK